MVKTTTDSKTNLRELQNKILHDFGLEHLPPENQAEVILGITSIIQQNIILRLLEEELDEKDKDELDRFLAKEKDNPEAVIAFLRAKVPHLDKIAAEEIEKFKKQSTSFLEKETENAAEDKEDKNNQYKE